MDCRVAVVARAAFGLPRQDPVGGPVANATKPRAVHKGLQQVNGVAILPRPVRAEAAQYFGKNMTGQVRYLHPFFCALIFTSVLNF